MVSPSTLVVSMVETSPRIEEAEATEVLLVEDDTRAVGPVSPPGTSVQSPVLTLGQPASSPLLGLFLRRGDEEAAIGYGDFLERPEEIKALPLKEQWWHLKNRSSR